MKQDKRCGGRRRYRRGFTLIELMVVMSIIALLLTIAVPRYLSSLERSKEAVLHSDLTTLREAIDKYYGDRAKYPDTLDELVSSKYLRNLPKDPFTDSPTTWVVVPPDDPSKGAVYDVKSGAPGKGQDGTAYSEW
nr:prepilin-type N-terminal cleavage/methylation domain-containing protein [uncultured Pseudogulbenkiania sp.]